MEQLQSHIWLTASSYMGKYLRISSYIRKPFLIYTLQLLHSEFPYKWGKFDCLFFQCGHPAHIQTLATDIKKSLAISFIVALDHPSCAFFLSGSASPSLCILFLVGFQPPGSILNSSYPKKDVNKYLAISVIAALGHPSCAFLFSGSTLPSLCILVFVRFQPPGGHPFYFLSKERCK